MAESTEITFKTITQEVFKLKLPLLTTIGEIKKKISEDKGDDFEIERQKLIYNGKVLDDAQTLDEIKVDEKKYIVVMVSRKKVEQPVVSVPPSVKAEAVKSETPAPSAEASSTSTPAPVVSNPAAVAVPPEHQESVTAIEAMGYPREEVIRALHAAFWNADRAIEYLCTGIPESAIAEEGADESMEPGLGEDDDPLTFLRDSPQFAQLCQLVRSQPDMLPQVLTQIAASNPELMQVIRENQEAFVQMLNEGAEGEQPAEGAAEVGGQPSHQAGHMTIAITETDREAIRRLQSMGFHEQLVIEAYFACDKNEDLAVNYILSRMDEAANQEE